MNDQSSQMMNQPPPPMMSQPQIMSQNQVMNPVQLNQNPVQLNQNPAVMNQAQPSLMMMNQRSYNPWPQQQQQQQQQQSSMDPFQNQQLQNHPLKFNNNMINNNFVPSKPRTNWKGKNVNNKEQRRMEKPIMMSNNPNTGGGYKPPSLNDLQTQNRMKARKYYHPKKKFNNRFFAPYAPRNTTSFIIRAKKAGGIASLVSPCPVTPAVLPTPIFSPSREVLGDMAKEEWGVDGYGSMKGLIRLRSPGNDADDEDEEGNGSSESDVEEHVEVERRLDHDLSRFEMIYPTYGASGGDYSYNNVLENRVDDQDTHIAQLEEENLTLKERLFLMERELGDLRRRMQFLERKHGQGSGVVEDVNEEVVENVSENESDGGSDVGAAGDENNEEVMDYVGGNVSNDVKETHDVCMEETAPKDDELKCKSAGNEFAIIDKVSVKEDEVKGEEVRNVKEDDVKGEEVTNVKEEDVKGEEVRNDVTGDLIAKEEELMKKDESRSKVI
ncbi:uncharacterized protein LOC8267532 [Ricinus communis]|uniref:PRLI-interacting factor A n=1 Tax=Ricinus communis TaxID=3988 RepID=B9SQ53_RICCO|nr:uncharacterized protein LOC8267532 [Ricinus communis]EEF34252.1 conserved hypothetical protein [Ricinus communis]|eukprot:XP_025014727.1 uncharacterized protein LOC8267532 [Ricinus communis]